LDACCFARLPTSTVVAADLSPITYATGVSQWNDLSGYGRHGTQGTGADQPTFNPNGLSAGRPALVFDATIGSPGFFLPDLSGTGWTAVEATYASRGAEDPGIISVGSVLSSFGTSGIGDHEPYSDGIIYHGFASTARKTVGDPTQSLTTPRITGIRSAANDWAYYLNGTQFYSTTTNTVALSSAPGIGKGIVGSFYGAISEIIITSAALSTAARQRRRDIWLGNGMCVELATRFASF
jgi:hypothetical protein